MDISFLYFNGCPNSEATLANLEAAIRETGLRPHLAIIEVTSAEEGRALNFLGSPSILVDGRDLATGTEPKEASFSCRIYTVGGKRTGVLDRDFIVERLRGVAEQGRHDADERR